MDSVTGGEKHHVVCIPFPAQGHINPMLKLAKLLHLKGFHITFIHTEFNYNRIQAVSGPPSVKGLDDFQFETIPDGLPSADPSTTRDISDLCIAIRTKFTSPFRRLINRINESPGNPSVTCIISDNFMSFTLDIAADLGIPDIVFCTYNASSFMGLIHTKELMHRGLLPLKSEADLSNGFVDTPIDWIPGLKNMRLKDLSTFIPTTDPNDIILNFVRDESEEAYRATAIILNTFDALEGVVLQAMKTIVPPIYTVGPLHLLCHQIPESPLKSIGSNLWKEDSNCLEWLEGREKDTVVYVNFGSLAVMTNHQLLEIAWGLVNSGHDFLMVIRQEMTNDDSDSLLMDKIQTSGKGLLTSWCPQEKVLMHPSIGGFLTHCGWNSTIESISAGVPMICWPRCVDQATNCRLACTQWGIGVEIDNDVGRELVEGAVKALMEGEMAKTIRKNLSEWKKCAMEATESGGQSLLNLQRLIKEVILHKENN